MILISELVVILHIIIHNSIHQSHSLALSKCLLRNSITTNMNVRNLVCIVWKLLKPNKTHNHYYSKCNLYDDSANIHVSLSLSMYLPIYLILHISLIGMYTMK